MLNVITGYSNSDDGILVVSDKPLDQVAKDLGLSHLVVGGKSLFVTDNLDEAEVKKLFDLFGEYGSGVWEVWSTSLVTNENLSNTVCW